VAKAYFLIRYDLPTGRESEFRSWLNSQFYPKFKPLGARNVRRLEALQPQPGEPRMFGIIEFDDEAGLQSFLAQAPVLAQEFQSKGGSNVTVLGGFREDAFVSL